MSRRDRRQRIHHVVLAEQRPLDLGHTFTLEMHRKPRRIARFVVRGPIDAVACAAECLARRPASHCQREPKFRIVAVDDQPAGRRYGTNQLIELTTDRCDVRVDICMVVFQIVQYRGARTVVNELRALVEKRRVVLIRFDHEVGCGPDPCGGIEIGGHSADQKPGIQPRMLQDPGEHAAGRGLAVSAGDRQHMPTLQHLLGEPRRSGGIGQAAIEHRLDHRTAARKCVAHHHDVGTQVQLLGAIPLDVVDTQRIELGTHRRGYTQIGSRHAETCRFRNRGNAAHERAGYPQNVHVHALGSYASGRNCCSSTIDSSR